MLLTWRIFKKKFGRQILKFSRFHSALAVYVLLQWPSVQTRILMRKLTFLEYVVSGDDIRVYDSGGIKNNI